MQGTRREYPMHRTTGCPPSPISGRKPPSFRFARRAGLRGALIQKLIQLPFVQSLLLHQPVDDAVQVLTPLFEDGFHALVEFVDDPSDFVINLFGGAFAVVALIDVKGGTEESGLDRLSIGDISQALAHAEPRDHLTRQLRCAPQVICGPRGYHAMKD